MTSYTEQLTNNQESKLGVYLSPLLLAGLKKKDINPIHSVEKSDVFTLGLSIIEAGLLQNITENLYTSNFEINSDFLEECLEKMSKRYSEKFIQQLKSMLILEENERPDADDLMELF